MRSQFSGEERKIVQNTKRGEIDPGAWNVSGERVSTQIAGMSGRGKINKSALDPIIVSPSFWSCFFSIHFFIPFFDNNCWISIPRNLYSHKATSSWWLLELGFVHVLNSSSVEKVKVEGAIKPIVAQIAEMRQVSEYLAHICLRFVFKFQKGTFPVNPLLEISLFNQLRIQWHTTPFIHPTLALSPSCSLLCWIDLISPVRSIALIPLICKLERLLDSIPFSASIQRRAVFDYVHMLKSVWPEKSELFCDIVVTEIAAVRWRDWGIWRE